MKCVLLNECDDGYFICTHSTVFVLCKEFHNLKILPPSLFPICLRVYVSFNSIQYSMQSVNYKRDTTLFCFCTTFVYICNNVYVQCPFHRIYILCSHFPSIKLKLSQCTGGQTSNTKDLSILHSISPPLFQIQTTSHSPSAISYTMYIVHVGIAHVITFAFTLSHVILYFMGKMECPIAHKPENCRRKTR